MKRIIAAFLSVLLLILSACGQAPKETPGQTEAVPSSTEKKIGLAYLSESEQSVAKQIANDENTVVNYVIQGRSSERLRECFAGAALPEGFLDPETPDEDRCLIIYLSDPEDPECLEEIASLGLMPGYHVAKGLGTQDYLVQVKREIEEKLAVLRAKVKDGTASDEEKELIETYRPGDPTLNWASGMVVVDVRIKTPWELVDGKPLVTEEGMQQDFEHCVDLFFRLVGEYEVLCFSYPV